MNEASFLPRCAQETVAAMLRLGQSAPSATRVYCPICGIALQGDDILYCTPCGDVAGCGHCLRKQYLPEAMV